jgi:hypothetical protein
LAALGCARAALEAGVEGEGLGHAPIRDHRPCFSLIRDLRGTYRPRSPSTSDLSATRTRHGSPSAASRTR